jgi:hypothetical protein
MTNWQAIQSYKDIAMKDCNVYHMTMGSFRANKSKGGVFWKKTAGGARKSSAKAKIKLLKPPIGGWK